MQVYYSQGLSLEMVDFVVVQQIFHHFLAVGAQEEGTDLQQKSDQLLWKLAISLFCQRIPVDLPILIGHHYFSFKAEGGLDVE